MQKYPASAQCMLQQDDCMWSVLRRHLSATASDGTYNELHCCTATVCVSVILVTINYFVIFHYILIFHLKM